MINLMQKVLVACLLLCLALPVLPRAAAAPSKTIPLEAHHSFLLKTGEPISRASVADPKVADVNVLTPTQVLVVAKSKTASSTSLILWYGEDRVETYDVHVYTTIPKWVLNAMAQRIHTIAPDVTVTISEASTIPGEQSILLNGTVSGQETLNRVLTIADSFNMKFFNLIRLDGPQQVQLKVVIAEVSKSGLKQMGINFTKANNSYGFSILKGGTWSIEETNGGALYNEISPHFGSAFNLVLSSTKHNWLAMIDLLKNQGLARTLATPILVTLNGQEAEFNVGGEYPVPIQGEGGQTNIEYKPYGIMLRFTPYIVAKDVITLEVSPEVSAPDYSLGITSGGTSVPGITQRKATTTLQLRPGQTFAMAGLLKEEFYETVNKIPLLGDLPVIGTAFTSKETQYQETELVVMVTPDLVQPMEADQVPDLPGKDMRTNPGSLDFFLLNRTGIREEKNEPKPMEFKGQTGFAR